MPESPTREKLRKKMKIIGERRRQFEADAEKIICEMERAAIHMENINFALDRGSKAVSGIQTVSSVGNFAKSVSAVNKYGVTQDTTEFLHQASQRGGVNFKIDGLTAGEILEKTGGRGFLGERLLDIDLHAKSLATDLTTGHVNDKNLYEKNDQYIEQYMTNDPSKRYWKIANNFLRFVNGLDVSGLVNMVLLGCKSHNMTVTESIAYMHEQVEEAIRFKIKGRRRFIAQQTYIKVLLLAPDYTVQKGDCLWNIAASQMGSGFHWKNIYVVNHDIIGDNPHFILPGQIFLIPFLNNKVITRGLENFRN